MNIEKKIKSAISEVVLKHGRKDSPECRESVKNAIEKVLSDITDSDQMQLVDGVQIQVQMLPGKLRGQVEEFLSEEDQAINEVSENFGKAMELLKDLDRFLIDKGCPLSLAYFAIKLHCMRGDQLFPRLKEAIEDEYEIF